MRLSFGLLLHIGPYLSFGLLLAWPFYKSALTSAFIYLRALSWPCFAHGPLPILWPSLTHGSSRFIGQEKKVTQLVLLQGQSEKPNRSCRMRFPAEILGRRRRLWGGLRFVLHDLSLSLSQAKSNLIKTVLEKRAVHMTPSPPQGSRMFYPAIVDWRYSSPCHTQLKVVVMLVDGTRGKSGGGNRMRPAVGWSSCDKAFDYGA